MALRQSRSLIVRSLLAGNTVHCPEGLQIGGLVPVATQYIGGESKLAYCKIALLWQAGRRSFASSSSSVKGEKSYCCAGLE